MKPCYIYWYHLPEQNNILLEGYVGITTSPKNRHYFHKTGRTNAHLQNAFKKYNNIIKTILCIGSKNYCLDLERKLRPKENIGWNIAIGGGLAPSCLGRKHTEETKRKISESNKGISKPSPFKGKKRHNDKTKKLIGSYHKNKIISEAHKKAITNKNSGVNHSKSKKITMYHINDVKNIKVFVNYREASEKLGLSYASLREQGRERLGKPNRQGWIISKIGSE